MKRTGSPRRYFARLSVVVFALMAVSGGNAQETTALRLPSANVPAEWLTKAEQTDFRQTPRCEETVAYCKRLAEASPWIRYGTFGVSPLGRELPLVIASKDQAFTPEAARKNGKLVVLVQNCIHAGECEGKDASLMLLRDFAVTKTRQELLDNIVLLVIPIFNVDGHERFGPYSRINQNGPDEMGWRVTARNLDLNRDYMKADSVEMRAWLALWNTWLPDLHFDNHTTDGGDWQFDLMFTSDQHGCAAPQVAAWLKESLYPELLPALKADGHLTAAYFDMLDKFDPSKGIRSGGFGPRYSTGYAAIRNRPSILVETHMLKPYRTRVIGHYNIMRRTLEIIGRDSSKLREAVVQADEAAVKMGRAYDPSFKLPVDTEPSDETVPFLFKGFAHRQELSEVSGEVRITWDQSKPIDVPTVWYNATKVSKEVCPPLGYIIPPQWTEAIERVSAHGLRAERLLEPVTADFESFKFSDVSFAKTPYEGRFAVTYKADQIIERRTYPTGSVIVRLDQPSAKVAVHMFEPAAPDALVAWGFFSGIFERKEYAESYILEKLAREMLDADPKLREEFEMKVRTDRAFAADGRARLYFFYERSPYWDRTLNVYPVARITRPLAAKTAPVKDD